MCPNIYISLTALVQQYRPWPKTGLWFILLVLLFGFLSSSVPNSPMSPYDLGFAGMSHVTWTSLTLTLCALYPTFLLTATLTSEIFAVTDRNRTRKSQSVSSRHRPPKGGRFALTPQDPLRAKTSGEWKLLPGIHWMPFVWGPSLSGGWESEAVMQPHQPLPSLKTGIVTVQMGGRKGRCWRSPRRGARQRRLPLGSVWRVLSPSSSQYDIHGAEVLASGRLRGEGHPRFGLRSSACGLTCPSAPARCPQQRHPLANLQGTGFPLPFQDTLRT